MESGRPEYAIVLAVLGVLVAIGVPALRRGESIVGWACIGLATAVAIWAAINIWRARR